MTNKYPISPRSKFLPTGRTLLIGLCLSDNFPVDNTRSQYTGIKNKETLLWIDLTVKKKVDNNIFDTIIVYRPDILYTNGGVLDHRKIYTIITKLKASGKLYVIDYSGVKYMRLRKYIEREGYMVYELKTVPFRGITTFRIYKKKSGIIPPVKSSSNVSNNNIPTISLEKEDVIKSFKRERTYKKIRIYIDIYKKGKNEYNTQFRKVILPKLNVTIKQFRGKLMKDRFIRKYILSIRKLWSYKIRFYQKKISVMKKSFDILTKKIQKMKTKGISQARIKEIYPSYEFYAGYIIEIENLVDVIQKEYLTMDNTKKNIQRVRDDLLSILDDNQQGFESIHGRLDIKENIVSQLYSFAYNYRIVTGFFNNICLMGSSGVGKTVLAKIMAYAYSKSKILVTDTIRIVSRSNMVGQYIGQTAPRTKGLLMETLEGILFIDEAYQLTPKDPGRDFGQEAITEIVNFLDKFMGMSIVIVAGYEKEMKKYFFKSNDGLPRRFPQKYILKHYSPKDLTDILLRFIEKSGIHISDKAANYIYSLIYNSNNKDVFDNQAGDMLNYGGILVKAIYSSYKVKWDNGYSSQKSIIIDSYRFFLKGKEYEI